jgi:ferredoxin
MATMITEECINCGACEPECPNTAIYQGGVEWEFNGAMHAPLSNDVFYIVPEKCTECVGFHDEEACAAVCPVDVCIPNPAIPESEEVLIQRARELHPGTEFAADFPSRFSPGRADGDAAPAAPATPAPAAAAPVAAPAASAPAPAAAKGGGTVEKPLTAPPAREPRPAVKFPGELDLSFDAAARLLDEGWAGKPSAGKLLIALAQPILGALPYGQKRQIERAVADPRYFSVAGATGLNALHNLLLYPIGLAVVGALAFDRAVFSDQLKWLLFLGVGLATVESIWRMRESFRGAPAEDVVYRAAAYGLPLVPLVAPIINRAGRPEAQGSVGQDGFTDSRFGDKLERERRYGEVYRVREDLNGCMVEFEFPRVVPPSAIKEELGIGDDMPDYDYDIALAHDQLTIKGKVADENVRRVAAVSPAFPPDFTTHIKLPVRPAGFRHRMQGKTLEIALPRKV